MHGNKLIRISYSSPHLTCIKYPQTLEVLCKIHDSEGRSLAQKDLNIGYFWPTMRHDSAKYVKKCDRCQQYKPIPNLPAEVNHPQNSPWPSIHAIAIDLVGLLSPVLAKRDMMIVATDYFTKWIEAEALSSIKETHDSHTVAHKERPKGDAGHTIANKEHPKGDATLKKHPKGDARCARNFLKSGLHASCGKYPGSYPFPKEGRIVTQLSISSVLREMQGDDQGILRDVQNTPRVPQGGP
ncbi:unnamed protein product [Prunus brigantina]